MYTQGSVEFNQIIETPNNKAIKSRLVLLDDNTIIDKIKSLILYSASCSQELQIGTTNMAYIDAEVESNLILTNREVRLECGVELSDGTVEYIPMGVFTIQKPQGDIDFVKFTANDRMQKFDYPYSSTLTYPTTDKAMLEELATMCGVALATNIDNPITIDKALDGYTRREVLGYIAGLHGKFACFNRNGELAMKWYNTDSPITKNIGLIWGFEKSDEDFTVSKIEVAKNNETTLTSGNGYGVVQHSNPLATQEIVNDLFTSLNGFTYNASVVDILDDIRLDLGDVIKVTYLDGKDYLVPCMSIKQDFTQGSTNIESFAKSDTENTYRFTGPTINYLNRMATELLLANRVIATKVDAEYVNSHAITTDNLDAIKAEIQTLIVDEIDGKYADIHLANIDILDVGQFFADSGIVRDMVIVDGKVTGVLDSVTINANNITSGTLTTDRLVIRGTNKSIVYELNNIDGALQAKDVDTLNGEIITPRTINADRIIAESITANELATESITSDKIVAGAITAEKLAVDAIMSNNYVADATGSFLNLEDGSFDSKYLKWDEYGKATITDLKVLNSLDVGSGGVYPDFIGRPTQWYMRANKYTGGYMSDIIHIGFETWDSLDNPTQIIDDTVVMSVYGGGQYGVEFPITVNAKNLNVYQMRAYEEKDKETGDILSRSGSIGVISSRFPKAYINEIKCDDLNVDGSYQSGKGNINAQGYIRATKELISKGNLTVDGITTLNGNTTVKGKLVAEQGSFVHDTGLNNWGTAGYIVLARLEVKGNWLSNEEMRFEVKGISQYGEVVIRFSNVEDPLSTPVLGLEITGNLPTTYYSLTKGTSSVTVDIIMTKQHYQEFVVVNYLAGGNLKGKVGFSFPNIFESTLRSGAVGCTGGTDYFQDINAAKNVYAKGDIYAGYGTTLQASLLEIFKSLGNEAGSEWVVVDANNVTKTSFLRTNSSSLNVKSTNGMLFVLGVQKGQCCIQLNVPFNGTAIYFRTYWYGTWYNWGTFTPT